MPEYRPPSHQALDGRMPWPFLVHDIADDETSQLVVDCEVDPSGSIVGRTGLPDPGQPKPAKNFYDMWVVPLENRAQYPYRTTVRINAQFTSTTRVPVDGDCTGVLIDAQTVLTAAHCIYPFRITSNGTVHQIEDWPNQIIVVPGWFGSGTLAAGEILEPYGLAKGTSLVASAGWVNTEDYDFDVGLIRLDRAVGMLTGWMGTQWGDPCSAFTSGGQFNLSFPGQDCDHPDDPSLHHGKDMYMWFGSIDRCFDNQLQLDTEGGCFNAGWGGMSGSPLFINAVPDIFVRGVASTADRSTYLNYCRLNQDFMDATCTFIDDTRGHEMDLHAMNVDADASISAGERLDTFQFMVANPTDDFGTIDVTWRLYLSSYDDWIGNAPMIHLDSAPAYFSSMELKTFGISSGLAPKIPIDTPESFKWLIVEIDPGTDANPDNNTTVLWDAQKINVTAVVDVLVDTVDVPSGAFDPGEEIEVSFQINNQGGAPSGPVEVEIHASFDTNIGGLLEPLLGTFTYPSIQEGGTFQTSETVILPCQLDGPHENQYIGIVVSTAGDVDSTNDEGLDFEPLLFGGLFCDGFEFGNTNRWDFP